MALIKTVSFAALILTACSGTSGPGIGDAAPDGDSQAGDATGGDAGGCPDEHGAYSIMLSGQGCGDLSSSAPECVKQTACALTFVSSSPGGPGKGLNGTANLASDGSFMGAAITEGTAMRTGCTGVWTEATSTLIVDCGGMGSSQSCVATLTRTSMTCN
jgi:hypothetical protein